MQAQQCQLSQKWVVQTSISTNPVILPHHSLPWFLRSVRSMKPFNCIHPHCDRLASFSLTPTLWVVIKKLLTFLVLPRHCLTLTMTSSNLLQCFLAQSRQVMFPLRCIYLECTLVNTYESITSSEFTLQLSLFPWWLSLNIGSLKHTAEVAAFSVEVLGSERKWTNSAPSLAKQYSLYQET